MKKLCPFSPALATRFILACSLAALLTAPAAHATPTLFAVGTLSDPTDLSGLTNTLENGVANNALGGIGSGLTWAGGSTFLALPDRGPNATAWNTALADTSSYIARFQTVNLGLTNTPSGGLPFTLSPTLTKTTLLSSPTALNYAPANAQNSNIAGTPALNSAGHNYFTGRSDNFAGTGSLNDTNARLDPEGIRVSPNGQKVYISDEYGPYVYEFDRTTGQRTHTYALPSYFGVNVQGPTTASEGAPFNTIGRVANKGMEGLALTPDGSTLVGFMQSPLLQDGGDGGRTNRVVTIDVATGTTHEYVYDNRIGTKNYNSSELLAINDHEFLVLERDGKGLGDGTPAVIKTLYKFDLAGATDVGSTGLNLSGETNLLPRAVTKSRFLDIKAVLNANGITDANIPAKLEGAAWGADVSYNSVNYHTLYIANDNDFTTIAGPNKFFVFGVSDADLAGSSFVNLEPIPEPGTALWGAALGLAACVRRFRSVKRPA